MSTIAQQLAGELIRRVKTYGRMEKKIDRADLALPATVYPVELSRAIHSPLIDHLPTDLMNHPAPPVAGAAVTKSADTATEREKVGV